MIAVGTINKQIAETTPVPRDKQSQMQEGVRRV